MKSIGIVRGVDALGRVVPPREYLRELRINPGDQVEMLAEPGQIIIRPYRPGCLFCGKTEDVRGIHGIKICRDCAESMPAVFGEAER